MTFYALSDATVYHGSETPERLKSGDIEGINIYNYNLNTLTGQKYFLIRLLKTELFNSEGQDHRRNTLKNLLNNKKYNFTYSDIKTAYDNN